MLSNTLNTNEVKNAAGAEVEFNHLSAEGRKRVFFQIGESPALPHRLSVAHTETGADIKKRRRSAVRIDKNVMSDVDTSVPVTVSAYIVLDSPVGALTTDAEMHNVIAELLSFCASTGANTTILYDGSGNGASALIDGSL